MAIDLQTLYEAPHRSSSLLSGKENFRIEKNLHPSLNFLNEKCRD